MRNRAVIALAIVFVALIARYSPWHKRHQMTFVSDGRGFQFFVDNLPDGRHAYEAYLTGDWLLLEPQHESGILSDKDWQTLNSLQRTPDFPRDETLHLEEPDRVWGVMQRGGETLVLHYTEWWVISDTQVNGSYHSMIFKQKASI